MVSVDVKQRVPRPDGKYIAVAQVVDGGATTSWSPQVYIQWHEWRSQREEGKVFVGYRSPNITVEWKSDTHLVIYSDCEVRYLVSRIWDIQIEHHAWEAQQAAPANFEEPGRSSK